MRKQGFSEGFNKEKLAFLVAAAGFAGGLYLFLASGPVRLSVGEPITSLSGPPEFKKPLVDNTIMTENFYVVDKFNGMIDPRTGQVVDRSRKTPFSPTDYALKIQQPVAVVKPAVTTPPPPPPPAPTAPEPVAVVKEPKDKFGPKDAQAEVSFMGTIVLRDGSRYGLLRPNDGSNPRRVKVGDKIEEYEYTVTRIEEQAIWVTNKEGRAFAVKDLRFSDEPVVASAAGKGAGDTADGDPVDDEPKDKKAPAPKAAPQKPGKAGDAPKDAAKPGPAAAPAAQKPAAPQTAPAKGGKPDDRREKLQEQLDRALQGGVPAPMIEKMKEKMKADRPKKK